MIVCDTGPLDAAADRDDQHNRTCTDLFTGLHLARRAILVPAPVVAEVGYLLGRAGGAKIEAVFLRSIVQETLTVGALQRPGFARGSARYLTAADAAGCRLSGKSRVPGLRCPV